MMSTVDIYLYGTPLGNLKMNKDKYQLQWHPNAITQFGLGAKTLSETLAIGMPTQQSSIVSFFGGLLPEAEGLRALSRRAKCSETDLLKLLTYTTPDLPGAVVIGDRQEGTYFEVDAESVEAKLKSTDRYPLGNVGGGGSLTGYQPKITLARFDGQWFDSTTGATSTHILKPSTAEQEQLVWWEHYCVSLARELGLSQYKTGVSTFGATPALVIERFDRRIKSHGRVEKIHQEDFSQILGIGWDSNAKFEQNNTASSYRNMASVLKGLPKLEAAAQSIEQLFYSLLFNLCIGNTDAHAKNHALIKPYKGEVKLAQLYDLFPLALSYEGTKSMALKVNGKSFLGDITLKDAVKEAINWRSALKDLDDKAHVFLQKIQIANDTLDIPEAGKHLPEYINQVCSRLLNGQSAFPESTVPFILTTV
ncbi:MAG: HipA domain-containing protein [Micrococcaceae bacterium]